VTLFAICGGGNDFGADFPQSLVFTF